MRAPTPKPKIDVRIVPRPVAVAKPGLIDLSRAPSNMEQRFGGGRR